MMMEAATPYSENCASVIKCENQSEDEQVVTLCDTNMDLAAGAEYLRRNKQARQDPTSHRIIEKRRRDRMNNCLADLSRLIPPDYLKKGRGRIEKTEIIEMATRYIKFLQNKRHSQDQQETPAPAPTPDLFRRGYQECLSEALRYLVEKQGYYSSDAMCAQFISHLQHHCSKIHNKGDYNIKHQNNTNANPQINTTNHNVPSHNPQFVSSTHNGQRLNQGESDVNTKDSSRHKHSNSYSLCSDEKSYNYSAETEQSQSATLNGGNLSPGAGIMGRRPSFSQQKSALMNEDYGPMDISNNMEDEEGATRINIMRNMMFVDKDEYTLSQDTRNENLYSPVSYSQNTSENSSLRNVRKQDLAQGESGNFSVDMDNHSYKFKNTIKQRFSQSQSTDYSSSSPSDGLTNIGSTSSNDPSPPRNNQNHGSSKFNHKRRKVSEHHNRHTVNDNYDQSSSGTNSSENNSKHMVSMYKHKLLDSKDSLLEDSIKSEVLSIGKLNTKVSVNQKYEEKFSCMSSPGGVPIFALHAKGSFYVPMNVDYDCLLPFLGQYDLLDMAALQPNTSLHPVTINVNFQPSFMNNKVAIQNIRRAEKKSW